METHQHDEQREAVRPDSTDLDRLELRQTAAAVKGDAQLAARLKRQQRIDARITQAMQRTEAPTNLVQSILARLEAASVEDRPSDHPVAGPLSLEEEFQVNSAASNQASAADVATANPVSPAGKPSRPTAPFSWSRRKLTSALLALAASVVLVVLARGYLAGSGAQLTFDQFQQEALQWKAAVQQDAWRTEAAGEVLAEYPIERMLHAPRSYQVLPMELADATQVVAYNYSLGRQQAYLFVARTALSYEGINQQGLPPPESAPLSAGWRLAAWRSGPLLYVLLHQGGAHEMNRWVETPGEIASEGTPHPGMMASLR